MLGCAPESTMHETSPASLTPTPPPVAEIERRLRWRVLSILGFVGLMVSLGVVAAMSLLSPAHAVRGLPDDEDARALAERVSGRLAIATGGLRFTSALTGEADPEHAFDAASQRLAGSADSVLRRVAARRPADPRVLAARAHVALARHDHRLAKSLYRRAIELSRHFPEARLGLGVTLAREATLESNPLIARSLRLQSLAQFAAVRPDDEEYPAALYDRATVSALVDRDREARRLVAEYLARDSTSRWAARLRGNAAP
jgi:hypothetical protein